MNYKLKIGDYVSFLVGCGWEFHKFYTELEITVFDEDVIHPGYQWQRGIHPSLRDPEMQQLADQLSAATVQIDQIKAHIQAYYTALDTRQHGGMAQDDALRGIQKVLGMSWRQGEKS